MVQFFVVRYDGTVRSLHRWVEAGPHGPLRTERWDRKAAHWVDNPNLIAVTGIGGEHNYESVSEAEATHILATWGAPKGTEPAAVEA